MPGQHEFLRVNGDRTLAHLDARDHRHAGHQVIGEGTGVRLETSFGIRRSHGNTPACQMTKSAVISRNIGHPVMTEDNTGDVIPVGREINLAGDPDIIEVSH